VLNRDIDTATLSNHSRIVGPSFEIVSPGRLCGSVLRGNFHIRALRGGLLLHACDAVDLHDLVTRVEQPPGLTIQVFLKSEVAATVGGRPLLPQRAAVAPCAVMTTRTRRALFERKGRRGGHVRKVSLSLSHDWIADSGLDSRMLDRFSRDHLAHAAWAPDGRLMTLTRQVLDGLTSPSPLSGLFLESRALDLIAVSLESVMEGAAGGAASVDPRDRMRLKRVEERLLEDGAGVVSLDALARDAGISVSTLQRLFKAVHGMSAFEFIRHRRLEQARSALERDAVSVKQAAFLAGYSSAANFSTAYRKHFGCTPRQSRRG
jgi:AraC-like DNA-binding protein